MHLDALYNATEQGVDIREYFYSSLIDNFTSVPGDIQVGESDVSHRPCVATELQLDQTSIIRRGQLGDPQIVLADLNEYGQRSIKTIAIKQHAEGELRLA
ncbi:hypothetical protein [Undibacterium sp.]|uniref:hypothetical protein n=1 Tax=Undibacterium sp. TaxID=1914977 RepID=UPI00272D3841|nr:hypothetical protein [Undibacterium sp.]